MTLSKDIRKRMIFKILVLGLDSRRRNGFLRQAAGESVSCQLHSSIGVSLGVAQVSLSDGIDVALQLWSLPIEDRFRGLVRSFVRGHRAVIVLLESGDEAHLEELLRNIPRESLVSTVFLLLDSGNDLESTQAAVEQIIGSHSRTACMTVGGFVHMLASTIASPSTDGLPLTATIPTDVCPIFEPEPDDGNHSPNSQSEVEEIRTVAHGFGLKTEGNNCFIDLEEGRIKVSMRTGQVEINPVICDHCELECKRTARICIIGQEAGWSSEGLGKKAILTMAKIVALWERNLPQHIEMQLFRSCVCSRFSPSEGTPSDILEGLISVGSTGRSRETLLELADRRVREGRLPEAIFNILKRRLDNLYSAGT